jgi:four helix bundle protein
MNPRAEQLKARTFTFGLRIITFCRTLRATWEGRELSDQLFRAGTRVGANYRSACRASSHADFIAKIGYVVEEADESIYWLEMVEASGIRAGVELGWLYSRVERTVENLQSIAADRQVQRDYTSTRLSRNQTEIRQ